MPQVYDNWERLVRATLRREWLREIAQRTPSDLSLASSASFNFGASSRREISSIILPTESIGEAFEFDHILRASNYFNKSNLIAQGHSGDLFFGVLDNEIPVVVSKIDFSLDVMEAYCRRELEFYGKAKATHSGFVPLLGYCSDNLNNRLFLVYKHMPHVDLASSLLREPNPDDLNKYFLRSIDGITRLKIATGVAEALSYLHHECSPPLVHRYRWQETGGVEEQNLIQNLPKDLRRNINRHLCWALLTRVPMFEKMDDALLDALCDRLRAILYTEKSFILREGDPVDEMLFIMRGNLLTTTTNGGRTGFFNSVNLILAKKKKNSINLKAGDFCGEELLTWDLDPYSSPSLPKSTITVQAVSDVEAFALKADDLKFVAAQFTRLQLQITFKYYSQQWKTWAACFIQAAWRRHCRKKLENSLREEEDRLQVNWGKKVT